MHHRQPVDQDRHVVAVRVGGAGAGLVSWVGSVDLVLVDDLQAIVVDVGLVDQPDVLG